MPEGLEQALELVRHWIEQYGVLTIALFVFLETFAFTGLFIPGFIVLIAAGYFAAEGLIPAWQVVACACCAGWIGNETSYWIGRLWGSLLLKRFGGIVPRIRAALLKESRSLLLYYHYSNFLRATVPMLCGSMRLSRRRWYLFNTIGQLVWLGLLYGIGYFTYHTVEGNASWWQRGLNFLGVAALVAVGFRIWIVVRRSGLANREQPLGGAN